MTEIPEGWHLATWYYAGQRAGRSSKVINVFVGEDGQEHYFKKGRGVTRWVVGQAYEVAVSEDMSSARLSSATLLPDVDKHKDTMTWNMEEVAFKTNAAEEAVVKRLRQDNEFEELLDRLQAAYKRMRTYQDKGAFLGYVNARITYRGKGDA